MKQYIIATLILSSTIFAMEQPNISDELKEQVFKYNLLEGTPEAQKKVIEALDKGFNPKDIKIDEFGGSYTPLDVALDRGDIFLFKKLLDAGASPNSYNSFKEMTILERAARGKNYAILNILLEKGANPNPETSSGKKLIQSLDDMGLFSKKEHEALKPIIELLKQAHS